jgi:hypothetical protein
MDFLEQHKLLDTWNVLNEFVQTVCQGRDESHGWQHMECVANDSIVIFRELHKEMNEKLISRLKRTIIAAWLHDVCDHKYDHVGKLRTKVISFGMDTFNAEFSGIMNIIDRTSYSKENNVIKAGGKLDWQDVLDADELEIRDIVSDADKCQALGEIGLERCIQYTKEKHGEISVNTLRKYVTEHADEKLLRLKDHFIRTRPGKVMATKLHDEFVAALDRFLTNK